jgi:hypothetical protein
MRHMHPRPFLLLFLLLATALPVFAQQAGSHVDHEVAFRQTGMLVLGSWAVVNIAGGMALRGGSSGSTRYFHEMNALWNTVNLGIAVVGYISAAKMDAGMSAHHLMMAQHQLDKILLFNAGLDLAYVAAGAWAMERGRHTRTRPDRWTGYGRSIVMQGAFLFVFDVAMVWLHQKVHIGEHVQLGLSPIPMQQLALGFRL